MSLIVLIGGVRSGKSRLAVELARRARGEVAFIATAQAGDDEMRARIERHRADRPAGWRTFEAPLDLGRAIAATQPADTVIIDCLTVWVANLLGEGRGDEELREAGVHAATDATAHPGTVIAVTNEVGSGVHPMTPLGRRFAALLGEVNQSWVRRAERTALLVAGRALWLPSSNERDDEH